MFPSNPDKTTNIPHIPSERPPSSRLSTLQLEEESALICPPRAGLPPLWIAARTDGRPGINERLTFPPRGRPTDRQPPPERAIRQLRTQSQVHTADHRVAREHSGPGWRVGRSGRGRTGRRGGSDRVIVARLPSVIPLDQRPSPRPLPRPPSPRSLLRGNILRRCNNRTPPPPLPPQRPEPLTVI